MATERLTSFLPLDSVRGSYPTGGSRHDGSYGRGEIFFCEVDIAPLDEQFQPMVKNYPLFPESIEIKSEWLSPDQKKRWKLNCGSDYEPVTILTTTFFEKKGYVTSYNYLKLAVEAGYRITRFIKICEFDSLLSWLTMSRKIYGDKRQGSILKNELTKKIAADPTNADLKAQLAAVECLISLKQSSKQMGCLVQRSRTS
jgi:hypothetical protein